MPAMVRKPPLFYALASFVLVIACLYWGRVVLIPVALATNALDEDVQFVMQLIPVLSTLEPQPSPNEAPGLSLLEESPVRP